MLSFKPQIAKVAKSKEFYYHPRFYDEKKEKMKELEKRVKDTADSEASGEKRIREYKFREAMNNRWRSTEYVGEVRKSNLTIIGIIGLLLAVGYYIIKFTNILGGQLPN